MEKLLSRDEFREGVFERDNHTCVVPGCMAPAVDAHHLLERVLWRDKSQFGGYYLSNGASVCETHHKLAEIDMITPQTLREWCDIDTVILPNGLKKTGIIDEVEVPQWHTKWGIELKHPTRIFCKYPSTRYFPFSPGVDELDIRENGFANLADFIDVPLRVTIKMDGSNVVLRRNGIAARNGDTALHESYDALKAFHAAIKYAIPEHIQLFGEWLFAKHSIHYDSLDNYLQLFRAYNTQTEMFVSWDELKVYAELIGATIVPLATPDELLFKNEYEVYSLIKLAEQVIAEGHEGIVVSSIYPFHYEQFESRVAKYVRAHHVQTDKHWSKQMIVKNKLRK